MSTYTCPMHPEVVSDKPGTCPKCGMVLVLASEVKPHIMPHDDKGLGIRTWKNYIPLIIVFVLISIVAGSTSVNVNTFILRFMTGFFLVFSGFKLMDLPGFAEGYATYDLIAGKIKTYGYVYPFIELAFGLLMLAGYHSTLLLWIEIVVMVLSGLGVAIKLAKREPFMCACLGTFLKVPLTYVTLLEDFGMALLAVILLLSF